MKDNFTLENIQKLTENSKETYNIIIEQRVQERIKWIKRKIEEIAKTGKDSYTYIYSGDDKSLISSIKEYFIQKGFLVDISVFCGVTYINIDWNKNNILKEKTQRKLFRHFI